MVTDIIILASLNLKLMMNTTNKPIEIAAYNTINKLDFDLFFGGRSKSKDNCEQLKQILQKNKVKRLILTNLNLSFILAEDAKGLLDIISKTEIKFIAIATTTQHTINFLKSDLFTLTQLELLEIRGLSNEMIKEFEKNFGEKFQIFVSKKISDERCSVILNRTKAVLEPAKEREPANKRPLAIVEMPTAKKAKIISVTTVSQTLYTTSQSGLPKATQLDPIVIAEEQLEPFRGEQLINFDR